MMWSITLYRNILEVYFYLFLNKNNKKLFFSQEYMGVGNTYASYRDREFFNANRLHLRIENS